MNGFWMLDSDGEELAFVARFRVAISEIDGESYEIQGLREDNGEWMTLACYSNGIKGAEALQAFGDTIGAKLIA